MIKEILQRDHPALRSKARTVPLTHIGTAEFTSLIRDMTATMAEQKDGIAIAAPQIGVDLRLFIVSGDLLKMADKDYTGPGGTLVFVNPSIVRSSREKNELEEGCLSVRWFYGKVRRCSRVTLRAHDETGKKIERGASGLLAQIFQHEVDHLDGILFTDKADVVWEMTKEEIAEVEGK